MKFTTFDKKNLRILREKMNEVLKEYGPEGVEFEVGNIKFSATDCEIKVKAKIEGAQTFEDAILLSRVKALGLKMEGKFGEKLVSYNSRSYKYPFVYEKGGKRWKCNEFQAKRLFG